jgi:hypothetical protein
MARYAEAEPLLRKVLSIRELSLGPDDPQVADILSNLATLYQDMGRHAAALPLQGRARAIRGAVAAQGLNDRAMNFAARGDYVFAEHVSRDALDRLRGLRAPKPVDYYSMARAHALIGGLLARSASNSARAPSDTPTAHFEAAMDLLRRAIEGGYREVDYIRSDKALDSLRSQPGFLLLLMDLAFPDEPFAH